ncbi:MAG TPA: contact-dependent growth inhibition system immunity protein [Thermoanaerobaculia bacterium]|jgi:hypothetical protein|nr:contact-dependent growth inhibition system immunity protein [Thermoanaerobaculia bacterium]
MNEIAWQPSAVVYANRDFFDLQTQSCRRLCFVDPAGAHFHFDAAVDDQTLGFAVNDALAASRPLTPEQASQLRATATVRYQAWVLALMSQHGYKSRRAMFKSMRSCSIELSGGHVRLIPWRRDGLEGWTGDGISEDEQVVVVADSPAGAIGAGLRLALERSG